ncbi:MAG: TSUP family transporter [Arachnia sp.]
MIPLDAFLPDGMGIEMLALVMLVAFAAGWVDAVVGGGGLLQLPALLLVPGLAPVQALATNKLSSIFGTATASVTYVRRIRPDMRTALPMAGFAVAGSFGGAAVATVLPPEVFKPIIVVALLSVAIFVAVRPMMGAATSLRFERGRHLVIACGLGVVIGFYDGLLGPGTGTFLIIALVSVLGYDFMASSAKAKIVNLGTNLGALALFIPTGNVVWGLGLSMAVMNMAGGYLGSRTAIAKGSGFVRVVFLVVVGVLILKLGSDVWVESIASRI